MYRDEEQRNFARKLRNEMTEAEKRNTIPQTAILDYMEVRTGAAVPEPTSASIFELSGS
jgi:hypothetical protein